MTRLQVFESPEFGHVRTTIYNGEIAFVAKDVAERLGYTWQINVIKHIPDEWKGVNRINTPGGEQEMWVLTEQGLYFFLARSDKPLAIPFQKWITGEVVPSIRKTGGYAVAPKLTGDELILAAVTELQNRVTSQKQIISEQQAKITADAPKVDFAEKVGDCAEGLGIRELALKFRQSGADFGERELVKKLLADGYCYRDQKGYLKPYA